MAEDKAQNRIGKRDVKPPDGRYRRSPSTRELCKTAGSRPGPGAPLGNRNSLVHGIYADRFMSAEERPLFETIIRQLYQDFVFNKSSDFMQVELVAVYFLKLGRAYAIGDWEAAEKARPHDPLPFQGPQGHQDRPGTRYGAGAGDHAGGMGRVPEKVAPQDGGRKENAEIIADNARPQENTIPVRRGFTAAGNF
jgi:hypothetical protein